MPELPEVQTTVSGLKHHVENQRIGSVYFHRPNIRYPLNKNWISHIEGEVVVNISRRAKLIIMQLETSYLLWHLGMSGSLRVSAPEEERRKHDHIEMHLSKGRILRFHDPRRFGYMKWFDKKQALLDSFSHYGLEPLSDEFDADFLFCQSRNKKQSLKNFIMNQSIVVGIGNIYACEALFLSGIRPQTSCGEVSFSQYQMLVFHIKNILRKAIELGGTTLRDFENADAKPGYFQQSLFVYGRLGKPCQHCQTPIDSIKLGGRSSFYCKICQH